jgi:hypothetical protein
MAALAFVALAGVRRRRPTAPFVLLLVALWTANVTLVTLVEVPMGRYTFYLDTVIAAVLVLAVAGLQDVLPDLQSKV